MTHCQGMFSLLKLRVLWYHVDALVFEKLATAKCVAHPPM
jgi:hypothetical protein